MAFIEQEFDITIEDVTPNAYATNLALLRFCEKIACYHSDLAGYGAKNIAKTRLSWILLAWKLQVLHRPKLGDKIKIVTWARDTGKVSTHRDFEIYVDNRIIALCSSKWALVNVDKGLAKIDSIIVDNYSPESKSVFDGELKRINPSTEAERSLNLKVQRRDIDINRHVHNLNYLAFAMEIVDEGDFLNQLDNVEITYKTEAKLCDTLTVDYSQTDDGKIITIKNQDDKLCSIVKLF